ncbi:SGNH/GDSL hydrolase family protein [Leifsonia sp. NPDC077715]|uniref:SGNH/GDSL hydrolase family protein n=1 Tax=Leifsonia sp. NPDC077715 TaxID=3155539 RepID=UPI0034213138
MKVTGQEMTAHTYVFIGDSITDAGRNRDDPESLGRGYVACIAKELSSLGGATTLTNLGVGGDRVRDLARRWQTQVLEIDFDLITIAVGINDVWRRFDSDDPTDDTSFERVYRSLAASVIERGKRLSLLEPFCLVSQVEKPTEWLAELAGKQRVIERIAADTGATVVRTHKMLAAAADEYGVEAIAPDGVHPTPRGHALIARAWLEANVTRAIQPDGSPCSA